jgi:ribosome-interacting GTPase 1
VQDKGGIAITNTVPLTNLDHESIKAVLSEFRISNADVAIREPDATTDDLIDVIEGNRCAPWFCQHNTIVYRWNSESIFPLFTCLTRYLPS